VQFEELRFITQQAALDVVEKHPRPLPPTVVLPGPARTLLLTLPELPDDDELRHQVLAAARGRAPDRARRALLGVRRGGRRRRAAMG
jgi:hypothetical protein